MAWAGILLLVGVETEKNATRRGGPRLAIFSLVSHQTKGSC